MKKLLMSSTAAAGACLFVLVLGSAQAQAADTALTLWNDANPGGSVTAIGTGSALLSGSNLGGISISTSGVQREVVPNNGMTESNLFITNLTGTIQVLDILAGTNGFFGPNNLFGASATILIGTGQADLSGIFYADKLDTLNGVSTGPVIGTQIGSFDSGLLTGPFSYSDNGSAAFATGNGPYGMAEELQLTLNPGAFVGVQSISMDAVSSAVPEPGTWAMMGLGFAGLGFAGWRKKSQRTAFAAA